MERTFMDTSEKILEAKDSGKWATLRAYLGLSGPGWLQSAITLGGGSLASALYLGTIGGVEMLWVQLFAMLLGVIMLCAISYITLSISVTPFEGIRTHINPVLAWGWLLATLMANVIWVMPQFSLAYASITENLFPTLFANPESLVNKFLVSGFILALVAGITLQYEKGLKSIKIYEWVLKIVVGVVVVSFMAMVIILATKLNWLEIFSGFFPSLSHMVRPTAGYETLLGELQTSEVASYWKEQILFAQRERMIAAAAAAVGINMTFLMPYSLLAKKWTKIHRGLAVFDLSIGMVIPFVLATSCIVIVSGASFYTKPYEGLLIENGTSVEVNMESPKYGAFLEAQEKRNQQIGETPLADVEKQIIATLIPRTNTELATSLSNLTGNPRLTQLLFGLGVLGMTLSTIAILILISVFVFKEIEAVQQKPPSKKPQYYAIGLGALGLLWPLIWQGTARAYLAIPTSVVGFMLIPVAFLAFFLMMNSKKLMGAEKPKGKQLWIWNGLMGLSLLIVGSASVFSGWNTTIQGFPLGKVLLVGFVLSMIVGYFYQRRHQS